MIATTSREDGGRENAFYNGMFTFYFSNKRTVDKLRLRITQAIQEQLDQASSDTPVTRKVTTSSIRVWLAGESAIKSLREQLDAEQTSLLANPELAAKGSVLKLENGSCIDHLGQNLVDQVFYDQSVSTLVVEISEKR